MTETPEYLRKILSTDAGMARFLDAVAGPGNWFYDPSDDVWVTPNSKHSGPGRGFLVVQRGGDWFYAVIPAEKLQ
jgi:hypothetical protein